MRKRVCCLYRVSTTKQVNYDPLKRADIPMQRMACHKFAESMGWEIVQEEQEAGVSGFKVSAADREAVIKIKEDALKGKFDILLVFMFDRLGRKEDETPFIVEWFASHGIAVWSVKEGEQRFDQHVDFLMNYIRFWQASGESKKTSMRTKTALEQLVAEGRFRGGNTPYGYELVPSGTFNKRKHEVMKLIVSEPEANVVRLIFQLCANSGYGRCRIASFLNDAGLKKRDGERWHEATIGHMLHNVLYMGILRSGNSRSDIIPELQIVSPDMFYQVQAIMKERTNAYDAQRTLPRNTRGKAMLSGNVRCGHCGGRLIITSSSSKYIKVDGTCVKRKRLRYVCYNKVRRRCPCSGPTGYTAHILDEQVKTYLHELFATIKSGGIATTVDEQEKRLQEKRNELLYLEQQVNDAQIHYSTLKTRLITHIQEDSARLSVLTDIMDSAWEGVLQLKQRTENLKREVDELSEHITYAEKCEARITEWANIFDVCTAETQKMIAGHILKCVTVFRDYRLDVQINDFGVAMPLLNLKSTEQI